MNQTHAKALLEKELAALEKALTELESVDIDHSATEPDEVADRMEESEEHEAELPALTARREEVEKALEAIDAGTYGICSECGDTIEEARLEANPAATTCSAHS